MAIFQRSNYIMSPIAMLIIFVLFCIYFYFQVYFQIEIITRTDFSLQKKTNWQIVNSGLPLAGNAAYAIWGDRKAATF